MNDNNRAPILMFFIGMTLVKAQEEKDVILMVGFTIMGSEFLFWEDNTYTVSGQMEYDIVP